MKSTEFVKVIHIRPELHQRVKIRAAELSRGISELVTEWIEAGLDRPSRHELSRAVRETRLSLQETQQQFAGRINRSIITVARWETQRPPSEPDALECLRDTARAAGCQNSATIFQRALAAKQAEEEMQ